MLEACFSARLSTSFLLQTSALIPTLLLFPAFLTKLTASKALRQQTSSPAPCRSAAFNAAPQHLH